MVHESSKCQDVETLKCSQSVAVHKSSLLTRSEIIQIDEGIATTLQATNPNLIQTCSTLREVTIGNDPHFSAYIYLTYSATITPSFASARHSRFLYAASSSCSGPMTTDSQEDVSPVTGSHLPDEIWENIIHYVGVSAALKLASVNRPFLNFVLSTRYREIQWVTFDTKFFSTLQRLQCVANNFESMR